MSENKISKTTRSLRAWFSNNIEKPGFKAALSSVVSILIGLLFGLVILLISNPMQAFSGFLAILGGGFNNGMKGIGDVFYYATPIMMTGMSVAFAYKTGLFNIGASGQFMVGAFVAVYIGVKWTWLGPFHWIVALLGAAVAGALWGALPGLLKAYRNVNEVISCIMCNYIGMYLVKFLVENTVFNREKNWSQDVADTAVIPKFGLDKLFNGSSINGGFVIAVLVGIGIYFLVSKTTIGYELRACGLNREAARYAGINEKRSIILSMLIAGALAGLAGGLLYLAGSGKHIVAQAEIAAEGFDGITVALLGAINPIGTIFAAIFIGYLKVGGQYMQLYGFVPEIIDIITAAIIYFGAFTLLIKMVIEKIIEKRGEKKI